MPANARGLSADALRIILIAAAVNGGQRIMPAEAAPAAPLVDLTPIKEEIAGLRREIGAELRDHDRRIAAVEREL